MDGVRLSKEDTRDVWGNLVLGGAKLLYVGQRWDEWNKQMD